MSEIVVNSYMTSKKRVSKSTLRLYNTSCKKFQVTKVLGVVVEKWIGKTQIRYSVPFIKDNTTWSRPEAKETSEDKSPI